MSYNVDSIEVINGNLTYNRDALDAFFVAPGPIPGCLGDLESDPSHYEGYGLIPWRGEGSGRTWRHFPQFLKDCCEGYLELRVIWEGGDTVEYLVRTADGEVWTAEAAVTLTRRSRKL